MGLSRSNEVGDNGAIGAAERLRKLLTVERCRYVESECRIVGYSRYVRYKEKWEGSDVSNRTK